jgi:hypothetical protein
MIPLPGPLKKMWIGEPFPPIRFSVGNAELEATLKGRIASSLFSFGARGLRGSVGNGKITVYWNTPGFGNSWRPVLRGTISGDDRESRIEGKISTFRRTQVFNGVWFGLLVLFALGSLPTLVGPIAVLCMGAIGLGMVALGQYLSRTESEKILSALGGAQGEVPQMNSVRSRAPAWGMKFVAAALALGGIANLIIAIPPLAKGGVTWPIVSDFLVSILALVVAAGILARKAFVWYLGFALIAFSAVNFPISVDIGSTFRGNERLLVLAMCSIGGLLVGTYWAVLWRGQRAYFFEPGEL